MAELADPSRRSTVDRRLIWVEGLLILAAVFVVGSLLYMLFR